jgi:hypothetical protein
MPDRRHRDDREKHEEQARLEADPLRAFDGRLFRDAAVEWVPLHDDDSGARGDRSRGHLRLRRNVGLEELAWGWLVSPVLHDLVYVVDPVDASFLVAHVSTSDGIVPCQRRLVKEQ